VLCSAIWEPNNSLESQKNVCKYISGNLEVVKEREDLVSCEMFANFAWRKKKIDTLTSLRA
jgi:hypothetical protein